MTTDVFKINESTEIDKIKEVDNTLSPSLYPAVSALICAAAVQHVCEELKIADADKYKSEGFGAVDPKVYAERHVDINQRIINSATAALAFSAVALEMAAFALVGIPLVAAAATVFSLYANSQEHPDTKSMGLSTGKLNTYLEDHSVILTENGKESFKWKKELVESAKHSIELSGSFCAGDAFQEILDIMERKLKTNSELQIHLMSTPDLLLTADKQRLKDLQARFPDNFHVLLTERSLTTTPGVSLPENHVKVLIIDETYFVMGGSNLQESMLSTGEGKDPPRENRGILEQASGTNWRDMDMVGKGTGTQVLRREFYKLWAKWSYIDKKETSLVNRYKPVDRSDAYCEAFEIDPRKVDDCAIKIIPSSPTFAKNEILDEYCRLLDEAAAKKQDVTILNMIFYPRADVLEKIENVIKSGAKVTIISANLSEGGALGAQMFFGVNRTGFLDVLTAAKQSGHLDGLSIREYSIEDGMYHKKAWCIGDDITILSSLNLGPKSELYDDELTVIIRSKKINAYMKEVIEKDKTLSRELTPDEITSLQSSLRGFFGIFPTELI